MMALIDHSHTSPDVPAIRFLGPVYAWSGLLIMWGFWACFIIFLAAPRWAGEHWPLTTVDTGGAGFALMVAVSIDIVLIALFGLQHSVMARPSFKARVMHTLPPAFERCTFVHAANLALFAMIIL
jgi:hypothetical protein